MPEDLTLKEIGSQCIADINSNFDDIKDAVNSKAALNGDITEKFNVANAVASTEAINKSQLDSAVSTINTTISDLETEIDAELETKLNTSNIIVPASTTIYVATTGNDTTGDGSSSTPYATITRALEYLSGKVLLGAVTIQVVDGTYSYTSAITVDHPQGNLITIQGNTTTPANCRLEFSGCDGIVVENSALNVYGVYIYNSSIAANIGLSSRLNSSVRLIDSIIDGFYDGCSCDRCAYLYMSSTVTIKNSYILALSHLHSIIECNNATFLGNASSKAMYGLNAGQNSHIHAIGCSISNATIGSYVTNGSIIADTSAMYTNCTTNRSPASNTVGNGNAYIAT